MKHKLLKCSLCCDKSFETKLEFADHLAHVLANLACPICDNKSASLSHLIEHLSIDNCQPAYGYDNFEEVKVITPIKNISSTKSVSENLQVDLQLDENAEVNDVNEENSEEVTEQAQTTIEPSEESLTVVDAIPGGSTTPDSSSLYIEIYDKNTETECLQGATQKLKLVTGDGHVEQYVIMSTENSDSNLENVQNAVITKQNSDGTISLHTIKSECGLLNADTRNQTSSQKLKLVNEDDRLERFVIMTADQELTEETGTETVIAPSEKETEDTQGELYSCNTCGVTFTSVFDHIQNYHNDQEVVVEEPFEEDPRFQESTTNRQEGTKRVITDTGDIVDANSIKNPQISNTGNEEPLVDLELRDKGNQQQGKRFVQIDKFCDSLVKNINPEDNSGPYHTVMLNEAVIDRKKVKNYYCMTCNISANNLDDFKNQPCRIPKYRCPHCPVAYENSKSLCAHMKVHKSNTQGEKLPPVSDIFTCEVCNTIFYTNKSLKLHKRMHDPVKSRPLEPPLETLDGSEGSSDMYQCDICDKIIPFDYKTIHQNSHKNGEQLNCGICNRKFHSNEYLVMHMSVHNMDKVAVNRSDKALPYSCLYCNRRFARPHEKVKHERIHTGEKPHSCEICGKSFRVAYCLTLHMRTHTGVRPYACNFCHKRFKAHSVYNHHLLTHSEVRRYKCPFCPKAFKTSVQLAGHKNSHTKPFSCQQCNRPFASLYAVRVHTETHARQNNLKFSCSLCGASYARAFALKDHMTQIHHINAANLAKDSEDTKEDVKTEGEIMTMEDNMTQEITELELPSNPLSM